MLCRSKVIEGPDWFELLPIVAECILQARTRLIFYRVITRLENLKVSELESQGKVGERPPSRMGPGKCKLTPTTTSKAQWFIQQPIMCGVSRVHARTKFRRAGQKRSEIHTAVQVAR